MAPTPTNMAARAKGRAPGGHRSHDGREWRPAPTKDHARHEPRAEVFICRAGNLALHNSHRRLASDRQQGPDRRPSEGRRPRPRADDTAGAENRSSCRFPWPTRGARSISKHDRAYFFSEMARGSSIRRPSFLASASPSAYSLSHWRLVRRFIPFTLIGHACRCRGRPRLSPSFETPAWLRRRFLSARS